MKMWAQRVSEWPGATAGLSWDLSCSFLLSVKPLIYHLFRIIFSTALPRTLE